MIILIEEHFKTLLEGLYERKEGFTLSLIKIAPEGLNCVGWGVFIQTEHTTARLKYVYQDRAKALAKLDSLLPQSSIIHITTEDHG